MKNDTIQGIVFDRKQTITFRDAPKNIEKLPYFITLMKHQIKEHAQRQTLKRYKPTFNTNLLPPPAVKEQKKNLRSKSYSVSRVVEVE